MENNRGEMPVPELDVPEHLEEAQVPVEAPPKKQLVQKRKIQVVANQNGFYKNYRKKPGDKFEINSESELGLWMDVLDPEIQRRHKAKREAKLAEMRKAELERMRHKRAF